MMVALFMPLAFLRMRTPGTASVDSAIAQDNIVRATANRENLKVKNFVLLI
jgi:hypothetical protein